MVSQSCDVRLQKIIQERDEKIRELDAVAGKLGRRDFELSEIRRKAEKQVRELDKIAKILVRRDLELIRANDELIEIDRAKSHFVSVAAHQLRTPISVIKWTFQMLLSEDFGKMNEEQKKVVERGYQVNEGMVKLVSDLLDVARIESGRFVYEFKRVSIEDVIVKVFISTKPRAEERRIKIQVKRMGGSDFFLFGDQASIEQAFENLVVNAINYTLPGGQIDILYKQDKNFVEVKIKDTGVGIPKYQQGRLFTKFFRGDNVVKMQTSGSGLGLFIAKSIINAHGGEIHFDSEEGKGSVFWVKLPIKTTVN